MAPKPECHVNVLGFRYRDGKGTKCLRSRLLASIIGQFGPAKSYRAKGVYSIMWTDPHEVTAIAGIPLRPR